MHGLSPADRAMLELVGIGAALVLLADLVLLWAVVAGRAEGRSPLARRWSAAHVLVAFQAWLWLTLMFACSLGAVLAVIVPGARLTRGDGPWMDAITIASLIAQNVAMVGVVLFTVLRL